MSRKLMMGSFRKINLLSAVILVIFGIATIATTDTDESSTPEEQSTTQEVKEVGVSVRKKDEMYFQCEYEGSMTSVECKDECETLKMVWYTLSDESLEFVQIQAPDVDGTITLPRNQDLMMNEAIGSFKSRDYIMEAGTVLGGTVTTLDLKRREWERAFEAGEEETSTIYRDCVLDEEQSRQATTDGDGKGHGENSQSTEDQALAAFEDYASTIEEAEGPITHRRTIQGDLTGDGRSDVLVEFGIREEGGSETAYKQVAIYRNTGQDVEVVGGFEPDYCPLVDRIEEGTVVVRELSACGSSSSDTIRTHRYVLDSGTLKKRSSP